MKNIFLLIIVFSFSRCLLFEGIERDNIRDPNNLTPLVRDGLSHWVNFNGSLVDSVGNYAFTGGGNTYMEPDRFLEDSMALNLGTSSFSNNTNAFDLDFSITGKLFTFEIWYKKKQSQTSVNFFQLSVGSATVALYQNSDYVSLTYQSGGFFTLDSMNSYAMETWYHIFFTMKDLGSDFEFHIYSAEFGSLDAKNNTIVVPKGGISGAVNLMLGGAIPVALDDFRIYNRILTKEEMEQNHKTAVRR